jgi:hypothetical protein
MAARLRRSQYAQPITCEVRDKEVEKVAAAGHPVIEAKGGAHPVWLSLICPCRCGVVLRVNLMRSQRPAWRVSSDETGGLSLSPSIDVPACGSHFWLRGGRVEWMAE